MFLGNCRQTVSNFYPRCRFVALTYYHFNETKLGGENVLVEIDESLFAKAKFNRGKDLKTKTGVGFRHTRAKDRKMLL